MVSLVVLLGSTTTPFVQAGKQWEKLAEKKAAGLVHNSTAGGPPIHTNSSTLRSRQGGSFWLPTLVHSARFAMSPAPAHKPTATATQSLPPLTSSYASYIPTTDYNGSGGDYLVCHYQQPVPGAARQGRAVQRAGMRDLHVGHALQRQTGLRRGPTGCRSWSLSRASRMGAIIRCSLTRTAAVPTTRAWSRSVCGHSASAATGLARRAFASHRPPCVRTAWSWEGGVAECGGRDGAGALIMDSHGRLANFQTPFPFWLVYILRYQILLMERCL